MLDILQLNDFKNILVNQISNLPDTVALCLSSGIDSIALLSLLLECNKNVIVYSFTLENHESFDFVTAKTLASMKNLKFVSVMLPESLDVLKHDIMVLHEKFECEKKTDYECVWPFLYVYKSVCEDLIVTGLGAEGHFGTTKKACIHYKNDLDEYRRLFFSRPNVNQIKQHKLLCEQYEIDNWFPFLTDDVKNYFMNKSWYELNKPHIKNPVFNIILDEFKPFIKSSNLQLGSGISVHFDKLLETNWNLHNYKSVTGIFNSIKRGEIKDAETTVYRKRLF